MSRDAALGVIVRLLARGPQVAPVDQAVLVLSVGVRFWGVAAVGVVRRAKSSGSGAQWPQVALVDQAGEEGRGVVVREGILAVVKG